MNNQHNLTVNDLALLVLAHFEREEAMLETSQNVLQEFRTHLVQGDMSGLYQAIENQQSAAKSAADLATARQRLRERIIQQLRVPPHQANLRTIADLVHGDLRDRLLQCRKRLADMTRQVERLNRSNQALIRQSIDLLQGLWEGLGGMPVANHTYSRDGNLDTGGMSNFVHTEC